MKKRWIILICAIVVLSFTTLAISAHEKAKPSKKDSKESLYTQVELFSDAVSLIRSEYVDEVDSKKLIYGAMRGMLESLDDFSEFMEPDEYNEIKIETKGEFGGIGVEISARSGILTIVAPIAGTPAESVGLKSGDKILRIDGTVTKGMDMNDAVKKMRGKPGSAVTLTIWREKDDKIFDVSVKRAIIKIKSIKKAEFAEDKIGYIKLVEFQENTPKDLEEALKKLESQGMEGLILDLRNNPGGLLEVSIDVSEKFLPKDQVIVSIKSRNPANNSVFKSSGRSTHPNYPLVLLVNEGSASASEIVSGAIQDNKRGIIVGKKTFGKASVQTVVALKDGSAVRLTTAYYLTPSGKIIKNEGIAPDIVVDKEELPARKAESDIFERLEESQKPAAKEKAPEKRKPAAVEKGKPAEEKKIAAAPEEPGRDNQLERAIDIIKALKIYKGVKS